MLAVKAPDGREIAHGEPEQLEDGDCECVIKLPGRLVAGRYTVALSLSAGGKPFGVPVEQSFEKKDFAFEGNRIGVTDKVLFPWTPMKVEAAAVSCWNRTFVLNDDGFFRQVKSGNWELLSRPVFLVARSADKEMKWQGGGVQFTKQGPSAVDFMADAQCEKLQADVSVHSEFDGMFQYTLTLRPMGDGRVDGVDLVVPIKEEHAWLLHACSDGCRTNASLFTPRGQGRVWDSTKVSQWRLTGTFIPYLWLGDDRVGLCWWSDSEKGWLRPANRKEPAMEVRRATGEVQMVFHLIARPIQLKEPRTMVFAFSANPVRPRPQWAHTWSDYSNYSTPKPGCLPGPKVWWLGSCQWVSFNKDVLPDRPYTYASLRPISDEAGVFLKDKIVAASHAKQQKVVVYTDILSRAVDRGDEMKHYASEWTRQGESFTQEETRKWPSNSQILANLAQSRIDYDLWCMKHDAELGIDGFNFDEIQTWGQSNPVAGLGFQAEDGHWEPQTSLFAMRTYFKRVYTMLQERGDKEPFVLPHTSSTLYSGPLAFTTIQTATEMDSGSLGPKSVYDPLRGQVFGLGEAYALCNIMTLNHGFESGHAITPFPHDMFGKGDFRILRTFLGGMLLFDCHACFVAGPEPCRLEYSLGKFGYDRPGVEFVPYWRAADLQTVEPECVRVSLFRNGKNALLVMCSDNDHTVKARWKPTARFKHTGQSMTIPDLEFARSDWALANPREKLDTAPVRERDGSWTLDVPPYDYRLIHTETEGTWGPKQGWGPVDPKLFERNLK
jgi:hypothetical protein